MDDGGVAQSLQSLIGAGDVVVVPEIAYPTYAVGAMVAGCEVIASDSLTALGPRRPKLIWLNSPSNPCGTMYTPDEIRALAAIIEQAARDVAPELVVISDEMYEKIIFGGIPHLSIGSIPSIAGRVVTCNALSKTYAMTGWRVGYCAGSGEFGLKLSKAIQALQGHSTTAIPTFDKTCKPSADSAKPVFMIVWSRV